MTLIMQVHLISDVHDAKHLLILMSDCDKAAIKSLSQEVSCCVLTKKLPNPRRDANKHTYYSANEL